MREILSLIANSEREMEAKGAVTAAEAGSVLILFVAMVAGFWMILGPAATTRLLIEVGTVSVTAITGAFAIRALSRG